MEIKLITGTNEPQVFKEYELKVIECLELTGDIPIENKAIWDYLALWGVKISRASVINFVQGLHDLELVTGIERNGKGGSRFAYTLVNHDRKLFDSQIISLLMDGLVCLYPDAQFQGILSTSLVAGGAA